MALMNKRTVYRWCFGYRIGKDVRIGIAYLDCASLSICNQSSISHGTVLWGCGEVQLGAHVVIGEKPGQDGGKHQPQHALG
jgi:hypothetical protein